MVVVVVVVVVMVVVVVGGWRRRKRTRSKPQEVSLSILDRCLRNCRQQS